MSSSPRGGLSGLRVVAFESRRQAEMAELVRRHGGEPISAPAMRELPLDDTRQAHEAVRALDAGHIDLLVLMTGVGLRTLAAAVAAEWPPQRLGAALRRAKLVARGPKPVAALRELGLGPDLVVAEPNTWREVLAALDAQFRLAGKRVAVQEYGAPQAEFVAALRQRGATVTPIAVYRWALPEDLGPLRDAVAAICAGAAEVALFTSATQVAHVFRVAAGDAVGDATVDAAGDADRLRTALNRLAVGSIGPVCTEMLRQYGVVPDFEPEHGKMGQLVGAAAERAAAVLAAKRAAARKGTPSP